MPATTFPDYSENLSRSLTILVSLGQARLVDFQLDQRSMLRGFIAGVLAFSDDSELHFREFIDLTATEPRVMYAYHYQDATQSLTFRYDNAAHKPLLPQADHKHLPDGIISVTTVPTLFEVINEVLR